MGKDTQVYISKLFESRKPSAIRLAQMEFAKRRDGVGAVNTALGNVSLPMHPAMQERMRRIGEKDSPFAGGVVRYTATVGLEETNKALLNVIAASGFETDDLFSQVTDGGSQAMELVILGCCGPAGSQERPLLLIDAAYTNYAAMASRLGRAMVSVSRRLGKDGKFSLPEMDEIERVMKKYKPGAVLVIPYDNPTGQFFPQVAIDDLARLAVKYGCFLVSDEAYRELYYSNEAKRGVSEAVGLMHGRVREMDGSEKFMEKPGESLKMETLNVGQEIGGEKVKVSSVWGVAEKKVPGITGKRISIETVSKVWNACGLRIGALVTDNQRFHQAAVAENTASLCSSAIDQWIVGALAHESHEDLQSWFGKQREYYEGMMKQVVGDLRKRVPGLVVSSPDASIYTVVDVREIVDDKFDAMEFVLWCAREGFVKIGGQKLTLLVSPMAGFYSVGFGEENPGRTQMRIAFVVAPEMMALVPELFGGLLAGYLERK